MFSQMLAAIVRRGLSASISLGATSYLAHQFATPALGAFLGMLALGQLLVMVFSIGLDLSPIYMLRSHPDQTRRIWLISTTSSLALAAGCLVVGAIAITLSPLTTGKSSEFFVWGIAPFAYAAATIVLLPQFACLQGQLRLQTYNVLQVGYPASFLLLVIAVNHGFGTLTPKLAVYCWAAAGALIAAASAAVLLPSILADGNRSSGSRPLPRRAFIGFSLQSYFANCIGTLNSRLPNLLAALMLTPVAASQFAGTIVLNDVFSFFSLAIASVTLPLLAGVTDPAQRISTLGRACRLNTTATLAAVVVFLALFEPLCGLLLGPSFATPSFRLMSAVVLLCAVAHSTARLLCTDFASQGRPLTSALPNIPAAMLFAGTFWMMHGWMEPWGTLLSYCVSSLGFSILTFALYRSRFRIGVRDIGLITRADLKVALAATQRYRQFRNAGVPR